MLLFRFENNLLQMLHFYPSVTHSCLSSLALMACYARHPPSLTLITHLTILQDPWASCGHQPWLASSMNQKHPEQVLATGKLSHLRQTKQSFSMSTQRKGERCSFFAMLMTIRDGFPSIIHFLLVASHSSELSLDFSMNSSSPHSYTQI